MFLKKELTEYNRYQAFAVHMAISLVIFFILLVCITQYWYPGILFDTGNGWKAIGMIVGIDLVLGPLLTLIVFNHNKSSLKFDLAIIALVQTAALVYGTWTIYTSHPLAIAHINTSFVTLHANAQNAAQIKERINLLNTNQFFYVFNETNPSSTLNTAQFEAYNTHSKEVLSIKSGYSTETKEKIFIEIDPLSTKNRYILIDQDTGKIIGFSSQRPTTN